MTSASGRARGRCLLLAAALLMLAAMAALGGRADDAGAENLHLAPSQASRLLRLHDLQIGYSGLAGECARLRAPEGTPRKLASFISRYKPSGCLAVYYRNFETVVGDEPDPVAVGSATLRARSAKEAEGAWSLVPVLLSRLLDDEIPDEVTPPATVGEATRMFHARSFLSSSGSGTFVVWRSGDTLAVIYTDGSLAPVNDHDAIELARRQQAHLESPTPYAAAENSDSDVSLDDPALKLPVYWLGRGFRAAGGLPSSHLFYGYWTDENRGHASQRTTLIYQHRLALESWTPAGFKRYLATTAAARRQRTSPCTTARTVSLPLGRARVYAGYLGDPTTCPDRRPNSYLADVFLDGAVVQIDPVNHPYFPGPPFGERPSLARPCRACAGDLGRFSYNSRRGVLAIARSLTLRIPRAPRGVPVPTP